ncbi:hypothetical protein ES703_58345 [subsurface metagenome]
MDAENDMEKVRIVVNVTRSALDCVDHLVALGVYLNRQTVIRAGIRKVLKENKLPPFYPLVPEEAST